MFNLTVAEKYLLNLSRYKRKFVSVWKKLCKLTNRPTSTGRPIERKFKFRSKETLYHFDFSWLIFFCLILNFGLTFVTFLNQIILEQLEQEFIIKDACSTSVLDWAYALIAVVFQLNRVGKG